MNAERWRQVTRVYRAVMTKPPAARAAALADLCPDDEALRKEVESLLADESGASVLDRPLGEVASSLADQNLSGRALGPYRLESAIGAGGMGQVYLANDTRLHRTVAIKVLAPSLAHDPQFRARFDREAKAIAALNHPHILSLYDIGSSEGIDYLVMEYVEGETLSTRLERGALPFDQALTTAIQIAEALAAAHRQGIVHRDLKPGNVMLTKTGAKLLDFGLAKPSQPATMAGSMSMLPTTPPAGPTRGAPLTVQGTILGTLQYMAPEQLEGKEADTRTDIFAFGSIAYEMFTAKKAFSGASQASLIGAIMHADPQPITSVQPLAPSSLERIVRTCLSKVPDDRWQSAADLARELRSVTASLEERFDHRDAQRTNRLQRVLIALSMVGVAVASGLIGYRWRFAQVAAPHLVRFTLSPPNGGRFGSNPGSDFAPAIAVSPDGRWIAYTAVTSDGTHRLWVRALDNIDGHPLTGSENARYPFWSPDSRSVGFFTQSAVMRTEVAGGAPRRLAGIPDGAGAAWSPAGTIVVGSVSHGLFLVPDEGGAPTPLAVRGDSGQGRMPVFLPDHRHFLYWDRTAQTSEGAIRVAAIDGSDGALVVPSARGVGYTDGDVLYARGLTLFAQPFDAATRQITGAPVAVSEPVGVSGTGGYAAFSTSNTGVLVVGRSEPAIRKPRWIDRAGKPLETMWEAAPFVVMSLSPDERFLAAARIDRVGGLNTMWMYDIARRTPTKLSPGGNLAVSHDGKWIAFVQIPNVRGIGRINIQTGRVDTLIDHLAWPTDWSTDGSKLLFQSPEAETGVDLSVLDVMTGKILSLVHSEADEGEGHFSPDGRFFAYTTTQSGRPEVWVQSIATGDHQQISTMGGSEPRWRRDGRELFYVGADRIITAVAMDSSGRPGKSTPLFRINVPLPPPMFGHDFDPNGDGSRFLVDELVEAQDSGELTVMLNWRELLKLTH